MLLGFQIHQRWLRFLAWEGLFSRAVFNNLLEHKLFFFEKKIDIASSTDRCRNIFCTQMYIVWFLRTKKKTEKKSSGPLNSVAAKITNSSDWRTHNLGLRLFHFLSCTWIYAMRYCQRIHYLTFELCFYHRKVLSNICYRLRV